MRRGVALPSHVEITERDFQRQVIDLAHILGWAVYHPWLSKHSERGWPDLALVKPPRLVLAELKAEKGKLTEHQLRWIELLSECSGVEVYVWRPSDLHDEILRTLRGGVGAQPNEFMSRSHPAPAGPHIASEGA